MTQLTSDSLQLLFWASLQLCKLTLTFEVTTPPTSHPRLQWDDPSGSRAVSEIGINVDLGFGARRVLLFRNDCSALLNHRGA